MHISVAKTIAFCHLIPPIPANILLILDIIIIILVLLDGLSHQIYV